MTVSCPENDTIGICTTLESTGAGLGVFLQYMGQSLPYLLILLIAIAVVGAIGYAIAAVIRKSITSTSARVK